MTTTHRLLYHFLNVCVQAGSAEEVASLLDMGANVNWRSADCGGGDTALLAAVRNGHCTVAGMLLAMGADPTVTSMASADVTSSTGGGGSSSGGFCDGGGDTALHLACRRGDESLATLLMEHTYCDDDDDDVDDGGGVNGVNGNATANSLPLHQRRAADGLTALEAARSRGYGDMAQRLGRLSERIRERRGGDGANRGGNIDGTDDGGGGVREITSPSSPAPTTTQHRRPPQAIIATT